MKPVKQTICNFKNGDCARACIASIFELPIDSIPNFMQDGLDSFNSNLREWCDSKGIKAIDITIEDQSVISGCYVLAIGLSPRAKNGERHAVVWLDNKMVHDPHLSNNGLNGEPESYTIFIVKDPSKLLIL